VAPGDGGAEGGLFPPASFAALPPLDPQALPRFEPVGLLPLTHLFFLRAVRQQLRHADAIRINLALPAFAGALLSALNVGVPVFQLTFPNGISDQIVQRNAMALLGLSLAAVTSNIAIFRADRAVYLREAAELPQPRHTVAYFVGKDVSMLPTVFLGSLVFTFTYYVLGEQQAPFSTYYATFLVTYYVSAAWAYLVAIALPRSNAVVVGASIVFANLLLGGSVITLVDFNSRTPPLNVAPAASYIRYALEALYVGEVQLYVAPFAVCCGSMATYVSNAYGYRLGWAGYGRNLVILLGYGLALRVLALAVLLLKDRRKKV